MAGSKALAKADDFEWTEPRQECLRLLLNGYPKTRISEELKVHYNTIYNWTKHPAFVQRLREELDEHATSTRLRRVRTTSLLNDTVSNQAVKALQEAQRKPKSFRSASMASLWLREFRAMRNEERLNFGESTDNRNVKTAIQHSGHVSTTGNKSFKEFLQEQYNAGVIDAEIINSAEDAQEAVIEAVQQVLTEGEYLAEVDKEEIEARAAAEGKNGT